MSLRLCGGTSWARGALVLIEVISAGLFRLDGSMTGPAEEVQSMITSASWMAASRLSTMFRRGSMLFSRFTVCASSLRLGEYRLIRSQLRRDFT
ncbi:hypothetical protein D3C86_1996780 [compost metagenome]